MILLHWLSQVIQNTHTGKPLVGISLIGIELMFSEIYPRSTSESNITEKNLMQLTGLKKNMKSCQIKESLNKPCQNSWGSRQNWSVPAFIKIFNHLKFLLDFFFRKKFFWKKFWKFFQNYMANCGSLWSFGPNWPHLNTVFSS